MTHLGLKTTLLNLMAMMLALFLGIASHKAAEANPSSSKRITDIFISENSEMLIFTINWTQSLTYSAIKQNSPIGLIFLFPDTTMDIPKRVYIPPENEIISSIKADEIIEDKTTTSRLFIALKKDLPYDLSLVEDGIQIAFPKAADLSTDTKPKPAEKKPEPAITQKTVPAATRLKTVTATPLENNVIVNVEADGTIKNYISFTVDHPPRIVFNLLNIKGPDKKKQNIAVDSKWVKQIRLFGYPDKVRLVLYTHKDYLSKYSAHPTDTGLLIQVGKILPAPKKSSETLLDDNLEKLAFH